MRAKRRGHGKFEHRRGRRNFKKHATHVKFGTQIMLSRCEDHRCGCSKVHCPFCNINNFKPSTPARVRDHLYQSHFKHCLLHKDEGVMMIKCYMQCDTAPGHFHCPYCDKQLLKKTGFFYHLRIHLQMDKKSVNIVEVPDFRQPKTILYDDSEIRLCSEDCLGCLGQHYHCPLCRAKSFQEMGTLTPHLWRCREMMQMKVAAGHLTQPPGADGVWKDIVGINTTSLPPKEKFGEQCHVSVIRNVGDLPLARCEEQECCRKRYHCCLCPPIKFKPAFLSHMQIHYVAHWKGRVLCGEYSCLVCYGDCMPQLPGPGSCRTEGIFQYHFHCPGCSCTYRRKNTFRSHLRTCLGITLHKGDQSSINVKEMNTDDVEDEEVANSESMGDNSEFDNTLMDVDHIKKLPTSEIPETDMPSDKVVEQLDASTTVAKNKMIWEVFDDVSVKISREFVSSVADRDMDKWLDKVAMETGVDWISSPGVTGTAVYTIVGAWDNVDRAKQLLRQGLPESVSSSVKDCNSEPSNTQDPHTVDCQEPTNEISSNPGTLDMLTSALKLVKKIDPKLTKDDSKDPDFKATKVKSSSRSRIKLEPCDKASFQRVTRQSRRPVSSPPPSPVGRRYSTRRSNIDFALLATGRKRKRKPEQDPEVAEKLAESTEFEEESVESMKFKEKSVELTKVEDKSVESMELKEKLVESTEFEEKSVESAESWVQTEQTDREVDSEEEEEEEEKEEEQENNVEVDGPPWKSKKSRLIFSSLAVIPIVTFDMQSVTMSKLLNLDTGSFDDAGDVCAVEEEDGGDRGFVKLVEHCSEEHAMEEARHCEDCMTICQDEDARRTHLKMHHRRTARAVKGTTNPRCSLCAFTSADFAKMTTHLMSEHDAGHLRCDVCERVFKTSKARDIHLALKHGPRPSHNVRVERRATQCTQCPFDEGDFRALSDHLVSEHGMMKLARCDVCERLFNNVAEVEGHLKKLHGPFEKYQISNLCRICGMMCKSYTSLSQHLTYKHKIRRKKRARKMPECAECPYVATSALDMRAHKRQHKLKLKAENETGPHVCEICRKEFAFRRYLLSHMKVHATEKRYGCEQCERRFHERSQLRLHLECHKKTEDRVYRYVCSYCGRKYNGLSNFKDHLHKHTGERPYQCKQCDKAFSFRSQLSQHVVYIHSQEKPHKCTACPRSFKLLSRLHQHSVCHTGVSNHRCQNCHQAYSTGAVLRIHQLKCQAGVRGREVAALSVDAVPVENAGAEMAVVGPYEIAGVQKTYYEAASGEAMVEGHEVKVEQQTEIYVCSVCDIAFQEYADAEYHINTAHEDTVEEAHGEIVHGESVIMMTETGHQGAEVTIDQADSVRQSHRQANFTITATAGDSKSVNIVYQSI